MPSCVVSSAIVALVVTLATAFAPGLEVALSLDRPTQGISISASERIFLAQRYSETLPPQAVELLGDNKTTVLYPNAEWNSYNSTNSANVSTTFTNIDGSGIGPDGRYWLVDGGVKNADGSGIVNGSCKLVGINLDTDTVDKIYYLDNLTIPQSGMDDVRFNGNMAYLSDTAGALVVLDLTSGKGTRVLDGDATALAHFPMSYNGSLVPGYGGGTLSVGLDQIEVSPGGKYLYYQPCNGGMFRIETSYVDAALHNKSLAASLGDYATAYAGTPSTGGTTIDGDGNIYVSDTNLLAIWKVDPDGRASILVQDDALLWTDLMWVDEKQNLWLPASQFRPGADGLMSADGPNYIFTYPINAGPSPIDHA